MNAGADIASMRWSLGLTADDEALVRGAAADLAPEVPGWVDAFYARQVTDPVAMAILSSEARVLRLKRTLTAWFHELFALPFDAAYERARAEIGRVHVRIGMPQFLMVTAMGGVRADVRAAVHRRLSADAARAERVARALDKVLDLELCLMLSAYARAARRASLRSDRELLAQRLGARLSDGLRDARDAAACYAELLRGARTPAERERWAARLGAALERVSRSEASGAAALAALGEDLEHVAFAPLLALAVEDAAASGRVAVRAAPPDVGAVVHPGPLRHAVGALIRDALRAATGRVLLSCERDAAGEVAVEVRDPSAAWLRGLPTVADAEVLPPDVGLTLAEHVAGLHGGALEILDPREGGTGVRLRLPAAPPA